MNEKLVNPEIIFSEINSKKSIYFTFNGTISADEAKQGVVRWKQLLESQNSKHIHVWNCLEMKGHEPMARRIWQKAMKELEGQVEKIWLITDSSIISAGAKMISLFTSLDIETIKSESEIVY